MISILYLRIWFGVPTIKIENTGTELVYKLRQAIQDPNRITIQKCQNGYNLSKSKTPQIFTRKIWTTNCWKDWMLHLRSWQVYVIEATRWTCLQFGEKRNRRSNTCVFSRAFPDSSPWPECFFVLLRARWIRESHEESSHPLTPGITCRSQAMITRR